MMAALRLSEVFHGLSEHYAGRGATLAEISERLDARTQAIVTLVLALPFLFFLPLPGLSLLFGVFIFLNGFRIASNNKLWFPAFLKKRKISASALLKSLRFAEKCSRRLEKIVKPRGSFFTAHPIWVRVNGMIFCCSGLFLALPLPPGTSFFPSLNAVLLSLGVLEEDNLMIFLAYLLFLAIFFLYLVFPIFGWRLILSETGH